MDRRVCGSAGGPVDGDEDVDLVDYEIAFSCYAGPLGAVSADDCDMLDSDGDGDVDLEDFADFQLAFTGS